MTSPINSEASPEASRFDPYLKSRPKRGRAADFAADILREAILDGVVSPSARLPEEELAVELSVSRTPVREALQRLAAEGLVNITAHQGATVAPVTIDDVIETYMVREILEGLATSLMARRRPERSIAQLRDILQQMECALNDGQIVELRALNLPFHKVIREGCGNRLVGRYLTHIEHLLRRFGQTTYDIPGRPEQTNQEHRAIVDAIDAGDSVLAQQLAIEHLRRARELRVAMLLDGRGLPER